MHIYVVMVNAVPRQGQHWHRMQAWDVRLPRAVVLHDIRVTQIFEQIDLTL